MVKKSSNKMQVTNCYQHMMSRGEEFLIKTNKEYALIYFKHSSNKILSNGKEYTVNKDSVVMVQHRETITVSSIKAFSECICIFFTGGEADYLFEKSVFESSKVFSVPDCKSLLASFENILGEYSVRGNNRYNCISEIYAIFFALTPMSEKRKSSKYVNRFLRAAIAIIEANPKVHIPVNELAKRVNVERSYLYKRFIEETGKSPKEYIRDYKLQLSAKELETKNLSVRAIYERLGFSSYYAFEKAFKKKYNMTPSEYRRMFCEKAGGKNGANKNHR